MERTKTISILNKISNKPLIMEIIYPYTLKRQNILHNLISNDIHLKNKLNIFFSKVDKRNNKLGSEFCKILENYSIINKILELLNKLLNTIQEKYLTYKYIESELHFSFINYLYDSLKDFINIYYYHNNINKDMLKGIIVDYYSSLDKPVILCLPYEKNYLDLYYINCIEEQNEKSKQKNRINRQMKLVLIFDENEFYNRIKTIIKYPNITEIELIFKDNKINKNSLFTFFNIYLSHIEHLENIKKIFFHNIMNDNYSTDNDNNKIKQLTNENELYQSLLSFFFDEYYSQQKENNINYQFKLIQNLKEVNIENITFLYIYEKMKLYYCIYDLFPFLNTHNDNIYNDKNIQYIINNKILIINNKDAPMKMKDILLFIDFILNNNTNIQYLFIVNHNILIKEENDNFDIKINISRIKEFMYLSEDSENTKELIDKFIINKDNNNNYNVYEGYDKNNKLLYYRIGFTFIQSFDLIDLFKYNKNIICIKLIKEQIIINYNQERTHLEIKNINQIKSGFNQIINNINIKHFSQFIYNQKNLNELSINRFDFSFEDFSNNSIKILNINYEKNISILKYNLIDEKSKNELKELFPNLAYLNIGCKINLILNLKVKEVPGTLKKIKILTISKIKYENNNKIDKIIKKFKKYGKQLFLEYIDDDEYKNNEEEIEEEEENSNEEFDEYDEPINNYKQEIYSKTSINGIKGKGKIIEKYDTSHSMFFGRIENKIFNEYCEKINNKSISIFEYSRIMEEYKKISKKQNQLYNFNIHNRTKNIKLKYRAPEHKKFFSKNLFNLENLLSKGEFLLIMKISDDLYFFMQSYKSYNDTNNNDILFFNANEIFRMNSYNKLEFDKNDYIIKMKNVFSLINFIPQGIIDTDIELKDRIIRKHSTFFVFDLEVFELKIEHLFL